MKKILLLSIFLFLICIVKNVSAEENYDTFQEIDIYSGKMLEDYTNEEYKKYYKNVDKRKFWGWRTHVVNKNIKAKFISETVFSYYNNGKTPITYKYELSKSVVNKDKQIPTTIIKQRSISIIVIPLLFNFLNLAILN